MEILAWGKVYLCVLGGGGGRWMCQHASHCNVYQSIYLRKNSGFLGRFFLRKFREVVRPSPSPPQETHLVLSVFDSFWLVVGHFRPDQAEAFGPARRFDQQKKLSFGLRGKRVIQKSGNEH